VDVKILESKDNQLSFVVHGINLAVANALRREMISEVPSMAIEDVIIVENSSAMRDDILAHRLGLIPLKTDLESYVLRDKCDCNNELGCGKCNVILTVEVEATETSSIVYSKEFRSSDPYVLPVSGTIPILKLAPAQKVRLEAYARLGRGSEHSKWQPVSVSTVRPIFKVTVDLKKCDVCKKCLDVCYPQIFRIEDDQVIITDEERCDGCKQCLDSCPKAAIEIESSEDTFLFKIESTGVLRPDQIFNQAIEILKNKTQEFIEQISTLQLNGEVDERTDES
jgi:DNA-directed RNA polymerase subunit D